uniref:CCHC-type domain-containing protein n=1 Tax=Oryzias latipes TaxID=8090 RepID=A0A3B3H285_ORYLA
MATIGTLAAFDPKSQTWDKYNTEILEQFFAANEIDNEDRQKAILISVVGAPTYSLMRNLLSPDKPKDKSFNELVLLMKNHYDPKPSEIVQRYKFDSRNRKPNETVMDYVAELRRLAQDCNYGNTLQQRLRDRLVCGINDDRIQRRLLAETDLTFEKALGIAVSHETAIKNAQDLQTGTSTKCYNISRGQQETRAFQGVRKECYRCKGTGHTAGDCKYKQEKCHACGKVGHIARACRSKVKSNPDKHEHKHHKRENKRGSHYHSHKEFDTEDEKKSEDEDQDSFALNCINSGPNLKGNVYKVGRQAGGDLGKVAPYTVKLKLDGQYVNFEIDTGCCLTVMSEARFKDTWKNTKLPSLNQAKIKMETYT